MERTSTPFFGSDIGDGFCEVPAVAVKILSVVLALAIRLVLGFTQNDGCVLPGAFAMIIDMFDTNLNTLRIVGQFISLSNGEAALARFHLDAVIGDAESNGEAKSFSQPIGCRAGVRVNEHRNHGARRHRSVESHRETLSLEQLTEYCDPVLTNSSYSVMLSEVETSLPKKYARR
jgi:hypothetical protein